MLIDRILSGAPSWQRVVIYCHFLAWYSIVDRFSTAVDGGSPGGNSGATEGQGRGAPSGRPAIYGIRRRQTERSQAEWTPINARNGEIDERPNYRS